MNRKTSSRTPVRRSKVIWRLLIARLCGTYDRTNKLVFGSHALVSTLGAYWFPQYMGWFPPQLLNDTVWYKSGVQHSRQRKLLNPVFSVNHMRHMIPLFYDVTYRVSSIGAFEERPR